MNLLVLLFNLIAAAMLQALWPPWAWLGQAPIPFLLGLALFYALAHSEGWMLAAAIGAGLLQDALGEIPLGVSPFCFCLAGLLVARFKAAVFEHDLLPLLLFGAVASAAVSLALALLLRQQELIAPLGLLALAGKTLGAGLLGAVVVPVECHLLRALDHLLGTAAPEAP